MPTAMTFDSLQVDLRRYLERGAAVDPEVYAQLPTLINLAERHIARRLKVLGTQNVVVGSLIAGTSVYAKPDRWRSTVSMNFGIGVSNNERVSIFPRSYEYCRTYWPNSDTRSQPEFYSDYSYSHWLIVPTPVATYPWEITYYQQPALLDTANQTNWLSLYTPDALLYRALLECEPFLKHDSRIPVWEKLFETAMSNLDLDDIEKIVDRSVVRTKD